MLASQRGNTGIIELLDIVEGAPLALLVWLHRRSMPRLARDMRAAFAAICIKHKCVGSFELGAFQLRVPIFEQVRVRLGTLVRSIVLHSEGRQDRGRYRHSCCSRCCCCCSG
jgi:hypothetical protein